MTYNKNAKYDFDNPSDRRSAGSLKWDKYGNRDVIPMWVADMDFQSPPPIQDALRAHISNGVLGYAVPRDEVVEAVLEYLHREYKWQVDPSSILWLPGLVCSLHMICSAFADEGDEVISLTPVYPPFLTTPRFMNRTVVRVPMIQTATGYEVDFEQFEAAISEKTRLYLHCNPQNPTGRVFTLEEQRRFDEICRRNNVFVCSDEIHCDLVLESGKNHIPFPLVGQEAADNSIVLMAPSKTYNIAGMNCAFAIVPDLKIKHRLIRAIGEMLPNVNALGYTACMAAYSQCTDWHNSLLDYLRENRRIVSNAINEIPGLSMIPGEATYLAWIDARDLEHANPVKLFESAGVGLSDGKLFGAPGFLRLTFGCSRNLLEEGLNRMKKAMESIS